MISQTSKYEFMASASLLLVLSYQEHVLSQWQVTDNPVPNIVDKFIQSGPEPFRGRLAVVNVLVNGEKSSSLEILVNEDEGVTFTTTTIGSQRTRTFETRIFYDPPFEFMLSIPWSEVENSVVFYNKYGQKLDLEKVRKTLEKPTHVFMDNQGKGALVTSPYYLSVYRDEQMWMSFSWDVWIKHQHSAKKR